MPASLPAPWAGLTAFARSVDLWPILEALGGAAAAGGAPPSAWLHAGLPLSALASLQAPAWPVPGLHPGGSDWPCVLDWLPGGPVGLAFEGDASLLQRPMVAIVGARACTPYGREWAGRLAAAVVEAGGVVVSGLAQGVDAAAHEGCDGATVAVLGQALDAPMPAWQRRVRERLLQRGGLVVSEFAPGTHADRFTFPVRNRIVAGLARVVVVVEAGHQSGAKNTVAHALRFGREVMALPGPVGAAASAGCLDLIEEGATMVRGAATVLEGAGLVGATRALPEGENLEARILREVDTGRAPEDVAGRLGATLLDTLAALAGLELKGRVVRLPGRRYVAARP